MGENNTSESGGFFMIVSAIAGSAVIIWHENVSKLNAIVVNRRNI